MLHILYLFHFVCLSEDQRQIASVTKSIKSLFLEVNLCLLCGPGGKIDVKHTIQWTLEERKRTFSWYFNEIPHYLITFSWLRILNKIIVQSLITFHFIDTAKHKFFGINREDDFLEKAASEIKPSDKNHFSWLFKASLDDFMYIMT